MVKIMKLDVSGIPCFQHFHLHKRRNGLHLIGADLVKKPVHQIAPGPKAVGWVFAATFGQSGHGALKGVAVTVCGRCQQHIKPVPFRLLTGLDAGDASIRANPDPKVSFPPPRSQRLICPDHGHRDSLLDNLLCADIKHIKSG